jgi:hypothetical protein
MPQAVAPRRQPQPKEAQGRLQQDDLPNKHLATTIIATRAVGNPRAASAARMMKISRPSPSISGHQAQGSAHQSAAGQGHRADKNGNPSTENKAGQNVRTQNINAQGVALGWLWEPT